MLRISLYTLYIALSLGSVSSQQQSFPENQNFPQQSYTQTPFSQGNNFNGLYNQPNALDPFRNNQPTGSYDNNAGNTLGSIPGSASSENPANPFYTQGDNAANNGNRDENFPNYNTPNNPNFNDQNNPNLNNQNYPNFNYPNSPNFNNPNNPNFNNPNNPNYNPNNPNYNPNNNANFGGRNDENIFLRGTSRKQTYYEAGFSQRATYFIVASKTVRPGLIYRVEVSVMQTPQPITVRASISKGGVEMTADSKDVKEGVPETLLMRVPPRSTIGEYKLRVEGLYNKLLGGIAFLNETELTFSQRSMTIFIQTDKPVYMQGETVRFRTIPITTELRGFDSEVHVYILDPDRHILRRWLSRQSNYGTVSLEYKLSDQPSYGQWTIQVNAQEQIEEHHFIVEEYYQTRFEVNVTMPAFFFSSDPYIYGKIMANFTSGAPVKGNLTLKAIVRPIGWFDAKALNQKYRVGNTLDYRRDLHSFYRYGNNYNPYNPQRPNYIQNINVDQNYIQNTYQDQYNIEKIFTFEEEWPFWLHRPETNYYDRWTSSYRNALPYLRFFNGTYEFKYPLAELEQLVPNLAGMEILITATVGERFYDEIISGYAITRIYNSSIKLSFLGDTPQVFKPSMPFNCYLAVSYHDNSAMKLRDLLRSAIEITGSVESRSGGRREYPMIRNLRMSEQPGVWELNVDLRNDLNLVDSKTAHEYLNDIQSMQIRAVFRNDRGEYANAELMLVSHFSPNNYQVKVSTSTKHPKVGEYIVFHIRTNFFVESFNYLIISKGVVLLNGQETIEEGIRSIAITLSSEMAPVSTIVVWKITQKGQIIVDSLSFPVNGISRNNFTVYINNRKARTGEKVEVAIYGEPGAYVGLSGIDNAFYTMQAGNELTYAKVITKMSNFDEQANGTHKHVWYSHEGDPDNLVYYPASTFGIDANRTFEFAGLVVFTDAIMPRRNEICNYTGGFAECLTRGCYRISKKCDGLRDCEDGTDEMDCNPYNETIISEYRKYRFNRIRRHYENVWLWKDINIGPHGRYIFNVEVPDRPALWMVSAFSVSPSSGFGMINQAIEYVGVQPFSINVEMPTECRQGEQVGIRVTVFNYMTNAIEATVVLHGSPDYKFVHVEENGIVRSYNPRTSFGEHQFFIYLEAQGTTVVYLPIVPTRLGDIDVTVHAGTLLGTDEVTRRIHVEADGLPQYRHQSILLDLTSRAYVFQYMHVNITETPIIPYAVHRYYVYGSNKARISVVGDVVGPIFPTMPVNATSLLHLPMDSAEQNIYSFAANLFTILYMRRINQRNRTTEKDAFHYMNIAYQRQLSYMKEDGSFTLFRSDWNNSDSSVWLTAYCARIFQEASFYEWENFIYIDSQIIQKSIRWILQHQTYEGSFYEVTWFPDRKMNRSRSAINDQLRQRNITLTAHVLITLATVKDLSGNLGSRVAIAQQKAISWIDKNMKLLQDSQEPYEIAIVAYALMLARAASAEHAFGLLAKHARRIGEFMYWGNFEVPQPPTKLENQKYFSLPRLPYEYDSLNIETTAYALLVYVSRREFFVDPIVRWLNAQRLNDGGWASTQDSSIALKALIEYTVSSRIREVTQLAITIEATSLSGQRNVLYIDDNNLAQLQSLEIPNAWGTVKVQAKGAGYAILQMHVQYNVDIEEFQTEPPVPAFDLHTQILTAGRNHSHISYLACQRWTNTKESIRSGMAVLDVTIPTGYFIQQQKLDSYVLSQRVRNLQRAKYQERKVLFYFNFLDDEYTCVNFTVERWYPVANMSRYLPIRVYDYYAPERFNETIFDALTTYLLNICEVCGSSQCPYCDIYNMAVKEPLPVMLLISTMVIIFMRQFYWSRFGIFDAS